MRRKDREVTSFDKIIEIISKCKVCRLAMVEGSRPYIVPLNFGYVLEGEKLMLYFHGAKQGKKLDLIRENPHVSFEIDCGHELIEGDSACSATYLYQSIVAEGKAVIVEEAEEKRRGLAAIMLHQTGKEYDFTGTSVDGVEVFALKVEELTAKSHI